MHLSKLTNTNLRLARTTFVHSLAFTKRLRKQWGQFKQASGHRWSSGVQGERNRHPGSLEDHSWSVFYPFTSIPFIQVAQIHMNMKNQLWKPKSLNQVTLSSLYAASRQTYRERLPLQRLQDEVADHPPIIHVHSWPEGVEDPRHPHFHTFLEQRERT